MVPSLHILPKKNQSTKANELYERNLEKKETKKYEVNIGINKLVQNALEYIVQSIVFGTSTSMICFGGLVNFEEVPKRCKVLE